MNNNNEKNVGIANKLVMNGTKVEILDYISEKINKMLIEVKDNASISDFYKGLKGFFIKGKRISDKEINDHFEKKALNLLNKQRLNNESLYIRSLNKFCCAGLITTDTCDKLLKEVGIDVNENLAL